MEPRHLTSRTNGNGEFSEQAALLPAAVGAGEQGPGDLGSDPTEAKRRP